MPFTPGGLKSPVWMFLYGKPSLFVVTDCKIFATPRLSVKSWSPNPGLANNAISGCSWMAYMLVLFSSIKPRWSSLGSFFYAPISSLISLFVISLWILPGTDAMRIFQSILGRFWSPVVAVEVMPGIVKGWPPSCILMGDQKVLRINWISFLLLPVPSQCPSYAGSRQLYSLHRKFSAILAAKIHPFHFITGGEESQVPW